MITTPMGKQNQVITHITFRNVLLATPHLTAMERIVGPFAEGGSVGKTNEILEAHARLDVLPLLLLRHRGPLQKKQRGLGRNRCAWQWR